MFLLMFSEKNKKNTTPVFVFRESLLKKKAVINLFEKGLKKAVLKVLSGFRYNYVKNVESNPSFKTAFIINHPWQ